MESNLLLRNPTLLSIQLVTKLTTRPSGHGYGRPLKQATPSTANFALLYILCLMYRLNALFALRKLVISLRNAFWKPCVRINRTLLFPWTKISMVGDIDGNTLPL